MTESHSIPDPRVATVDAVLDTFVEVIEPEVMGRLREQLNARDNLVADTLREAAVIHGAMPQLTAEVLCVIGIGDQPDAPTREMIHVQYHATMAELIRLSQEGQ